ncbi:hypothetical protein N9999_00825 [bacterium]|nr:hypothetical protein [Akkermansiaceae bacterium]MDB4297956.1 hypothetical protein [bacterium]MDA8959864.1 hypothetical protein [Akkermansiaceae bacterium]MDB4258534.1 hypothetical protein [Akkermansiaceae bacterium]MDB4275199.1 hypothetical protein [Akkermansiaceae bacterium]
MGVLLAIAIAASIIFRLHAAGKGHMGARFWILPISIFSVIYAFSFLAIWIGGNLIKDDFLKETLPFAISMAAIALECTVLVRLWKQVKSLPSVSQTDPEGT